ncbi:MAG: hypothetical protein ACYDHN_10795 [Solirubrobacteraceae bacterium]
MASRPHTSSPTAWLLGLLSIVLICCLSPAVAHASAQAPSAATLGTSSLTYSSVVLHGRVNPHGQATNYMFEYGPTRKYGSQSPLSAAGSGTGLVNVSQSVTGLTPLTTYHYRVLALSPAGAAVGSDRTFTTLKVPLSVAIVGTPNPVVFGNPFVVEGTLSGTGSANHQVMLQANPFPYLSGFQQVGNLELTNSTGGFSFPFVGLIQNAQIRVVTVGKPSVSSPVIVEGVAVRVTLHARATRRHGYARLYGSVTPAEAGALVGFQLLKPGHRSANVAGTVVKAGSATVSGFSRIVHVHHGLYQALVKISDGAHVSAYSAPVLIR